MYDIESQEGVLGQDGAEKAAKALIGMPKKDYEAVNKALKNTDKGEVFGGSAQMEKALILKAVGARSEKLTHPSAKDKYQIWTGKNSSAMQEITQFAKDIHGSQRSTMASQSTSIDPYLGNKALQQRWNDSCGPTTAQGMKAELDPIYARKLHQEFIHSTKTGGAIGKEQKTVLEKHGGVAVKRGEAGGARTYLDKVLNSEVKKYTGVTYTANYAGNTVAQQVLDRSQETPPVQEFVEEDFYLCCIYDMLEAAVVAETSAALQAGEKNRLDAAKQAIAALPFGSPQYRTGIRPRLEKHVDSALKKLGTKKK